MRRDAPSALFGSDVTAVHCVGVGGMGAGPLAIHLSQSGYRVSGEDDAMTDAMKRHLEKGRVAITGAGQVPPECDLVMASSAISPSHPALVAARRRGIRTVRRGELLAEVARGKRFVAVCGSHGKTTTTAMLITALRAAGFPAGYILGGLFADDAIPPARAGSNEWLVAEVDESDGTIDRFSPALTVAVNLDWDHPDHYRRLADLEETFRALFMRTSEAVLVSDACAASQRVASGLAVSTFGRTGDFSGCLKRVLPAQTLVSLGGRFGAVDVSVAAHGDFNVANATAALAAARLMGVQPSEQSLASYPGVLRRQTILLKEDGIIAIEDYAHHPAEIRALLSSLRQRMGAADPDGSRGRLIVVFQPHRYSRTAQFKTEFAASLSVASRVLLLDVYGAGEAALAGGTTADLYAEMKRISPEMDVTYLPGDRAGFQRSLAGTVRAGDWVAFVGAGDVDREARAWLAGHAARKAGTARWDALAERIRRRVSVDTRVLREEGLAEKTTMRVGGAARIYCEPSCAADLQAVVRAARAEEAPLLLLGRGSNLLVPDEGVDGVVVSLAHANWRAFEARADGRVFVGAGLRLKQLCGLATRAGLKGFEFLEGIPGCVGGALRMNAGAMGGWMFDVVEEVSLMLPDGEVVAVPRDRLHVEYRHCAELDAAIALGAVLRPAEVVGEADSIRRQMDVYRDKRLKSQPREPSAGCIFKNPAGDSAGRLIDAAGLKGERVGDAEVSTVHANFIVNRGRATSADVIALVRLVRARVREAGGVELEPEVLLYGRSWREVL
ncbi:MAG: UDP-N-acetylmuramate dehydrogenase [Opitutaceae bacterium]|nr:UDP-N-acetylmuramate dehydrogenase [Opitutaceae bacterium]